MTKNKKINENNYIKIYVDGSCLKNKIGGWGVVIIYPNGDSVELAGSEKNTTNNIMELTPIYEALNYLEPNSDIIIFSDSKYAIGVCSWMNATKNLELIRKIKMTARKHNDIILQWVKGHDKSHGNNLADKLATASSAKLNELLKS